MKKNHTFKFLCIAIAMLVAGINAQAQLETSFYLNGIAPAGEFNDDATLNENNLLGKDQIGTAAALGFGAGIRASYLFDIGFGAVAPFVSFDLLWNPIKSSFREEYALNDADIPNYFNLPLMLGIQYRYPLETVDMITPFAEFGIGYNAFKASAEGWGDQESRDHYVYSIKGAMAWQLGIGTFLGNHVSVGLHYYGLGRHSIKYSSRSHNYATLDTATERRSIGSWLLRIGFHF